MAQVRRFRSRAQLGEARALRDARAVMARLDLAPSVMAAVDAALAKQEATSEGWLFMKINGAREAQIMACIDVLAREPATANRVLMAVRNSLGFTDQVTETQAHIARSLGLDSGNAARAFGVLSLIGAVLNPRPDGRSKRWEVDATFATQLGETARAVEAARQAPMRVEALQRTVDALNTELVKLSLGGKPGRALRVAQLVADISRQLPPPAEVGAAEAGNVVRLRDHGPL